MLPYQTNEVDVVAGSAKLRQLITLDRVEILACQEPTTEATKSTNHGQHRLHEMEQRATHRACFQTGGTIEAAYIEVCEVLVP